MNTRGRDRGWRAQMKRHVRSAFVISILLSAALPSWAGPGDLDPTFGNGGLVTQSELSDLQTLVLQPDGKVVGIGTASAGGLTLIRYNTDGSLDATFGNGGLVTAPRIGAGMRLVLQPDGKLVGGGFWWHDDLHIHFALARFNTDGSLDATFGNGGVATASSTYEADNLYALVLQPDGKLIAAGSSDFLQTPLGEPAFFKELMALARFNADGTLDESFGTGGWVTKQLADWDYGMSAAVQPDAKVVVGGISCEDKDPLPSSCRWVVLRYESDGQPDTTFGRRGVADASPGPVGGGLDVLQLRPDGKIAAVGSALGDENGFALVRFNTDGSLDTSFGNAGVARAGRHFGDQTMIQRADGSLLVGGHTWPEVFDGTADFALMSFTEAGTVDEQFGTNGVASRRLSPYDMVTSLAMQPDKQIVAGGITTRAEGGFIGTLARFMDGEHGDSLPPATEPTLQPATFSLQAVRPLRARIARGLTTAARNVRLNVITAAPDPTQTITVSAQDGTCPAGTVGSPIPSVVTLARKRTRVSLPLAFRSAAFETQSPRTPSRCSATVTATGRGGSTRTIQIDVAVMDRNDS